MNDKVAAAIVEANAKMRPVHVYAGRGTGSININRRFRAEGGRPAAVGLNPDGFVDRELLVVRIDDAEGNPFAVLFNFACHGTVLAYENKVVSPDWIGTARKVVEQALPGATAPLPYGGHYVFRVALPARRQAEALAAYLVRGAGLRRIAVIHSSGEYGTLLAAAFEEAVRAQGGAVTSRRLYRDGQRDFGRHVRGVLEDVPQALFIAGYPEDGARLVRALRAAAPHLVIVGGDTFHSQEFLALAGVAAEGVYAPAAFVRLGPYRARRWSTQLLDVVRGRDAGPACACLAARPSRPGPTCTSRWSTRRSPTSLHRAAAGAAEAARSPQSVTRVIARAPWWKRLIQAVRAFLWKTGLVPFRLTDADIAANMRRLASQG